jgi:hypothetical protein
MLSTIMLSVIVLSVIMFNVIMLNVMAPLYVLVFTPIDTALDELIIKKNQTNLS